MNAGGQWASSNDRLIGAWWLGVELWYNDGDYLSAMNVWFDVADDVTVSAGSPQKLEQETEGPATFSIDRDLVCQLKNPKKNIDKPIARLLLFLAGCALDSGDVSRARRYLVCTLLLSEIADSADCCDSISVRAAHEYSSLLAEDKQCKDPELRASELFQTLFSSNRRAPFLVRSIQSKAFYDTAGHPAWCKILEDNASIIQEEFELLWNSSQSSWNKVGSGDHRDGAGQHDGSVVDRGDWREVVLFASNGAQPELAPRTVQLLRLHCVDSVISLAEAGAGEVIFSVLRPGTRIQPHTASHNIRLTAHLGLKVPSGERCFIRVEGVEHCWEERKMFVFDDSFEHSVVNESSECRAVLLLRFWHPSLSEDRRDEALEEVLRIKEEDIMRRHNPPIPTRNAELPRGMKKTRCTQCFRSGFDTVRLDTQSKNFYCICGYPLSE